VGRLYPRVDLVYGQASAPGCVQNLSAAAGSPLLGQVDNSTPRC
jgi:hypothetical protein